MSACAADKTLAKLTETTKSADEVFEVDGIVLFGGVDDALSTGPASLLRAYATIVPSELPLPNMKARWNPWMQAPPLRLVDAAFERVARREYPAHTPRDVIQNTLKLLRRWGLDLHAAAPDQPWDMPNLIRGIWDEGAVSDCMLSDSDVDFNADVIWYSISKPAIFHFVSRQRYTMAKKLIPRSNATSKYMPVSEAGSPASAIDPLQLVMKRDCVQRFQGLPGYSNTHVAIQYCDALITHADMWLDTPQLTIPELLRPTALHRNWPRVTDALDLLQARFRTQLAAVQRDLEIVLPPVLAAVVLNNYLCVNPSQYA